MSTEQTKITSAGQTFRVTTPTMAEILDRRVIHDCKLVGGLNLIPHTLGRVLTGWNVIRLNAAATFMDAQEANDAPQMYLALVASAPCTVSLEVF